MPSIVVSDLSFSFSARPLLSDLSFTVENGERAVIIGPNGTGKSTLLRIISGDITPDHGTARVSGIPTNSRSGVPSPQACHGSIQDYLDLVLSTPRNLLTRFNELTVQMADTNEYAHLVKEYNQVLDALTASDAWSLDTQVSEVLAELGLAQFIRTGKQYPLTMLSPGQLRRLELAGMVLARPAVLILDEPTNHLDEQAVAYLVRQIKSWPGPVVMASHDRAFIEQTATVIYDLDTAPWQALMTAKGGGNLPGVYCSHGTYSDYLATKDQIRSEHQRLHTAQQREKRAIKLHRSRSKDIGRGGVKLTEAEGMARKFFSDRAEKTALRRTRHDDQRLKDLAKREVRKPRSYEHVLNLPTVTTKKGLSVSVRHANIPKRLHEITFDLSAGEHLLVTGPNGAGKSTLLEWIANGQPPRNAFEQADGTITVNQHLAYVPQHLPRKNDAYFSKENWDSGIGELGTGVLHPEMWSTPIAQLSDGNQRRVQIALAISQEPEILVIDEPTNYLDLNTIEELETALQKWNGTIIIASHDRWLIKHWEGKHIALKPGKDQSNSKP